MVPIKIECECGQHYAFDVEPVNGRMPTRVACPTCGVDGTGTANDTIARHLGPPPAEPIIRLVETPAQVPTSTATPTHAPAPAPPTTVATVATPPPPGLMPVEAPVLTPSAPRISVTTNTAPRPHAPVPGRPDPRFGLVDRSQAEHEARAKAMWGDTKEQIVSYLMIQGFTVAEANELVTKLFKERTAEMRNRGISKIIRGIGLMCVPIIAFLVFYFVFGIIPINTLSAIPTLIGLYGLWLLVNGILMAVAPKSEGGDVANH